MGRIQHIREKGMWAYVKSKIFTLGVMMALIYVLNLFLSKDINYLMVAVIYIGIVIFTPILAWIINGTDIREKNNR